VPRAITNVAAHWGRVRAWTYPKSASARQTSDSASVTPEDGYEPEARKRMEAAGVDADLRGDLELRPRREHYASKRPGEYRGGEERVVRGLAEPEVPRQSAFVETTASIVQGAQSTARLSTLMRAGRTPPTRTATSNPIKSSRVTPARRRRRCLCRRVSGADRDLDDS